MTAARRPHLVHLARRFVGSLSSAPPPPADLAWVRDRLSPTEWVLWQAMPAADRRHAVGVARTVAATLGTEATTPVLAAALLHDVGKTASGLGTGGRVVATMAAAVVGRARLAAGRGRIARYLRHDVIGAEALRDAGSDAVTVAWAAEHHLPVGAPGARGVPAAIAAALRAADDD